MQAPTPRRAAPALALALCLLAAPALAAPTADAPRSPGPFQLLADLWAGVAEPLVALFDFHRPTVDPNGEPTATSSGDDPTAQPQHGHDYDPNG